MKKRPNIIIFNPDEMRYDAMSHMGNPAAETPFLDEFAGKDAISFRNAYCQNSVCVPSRCSFFTGLYPHVHGHRTMSSLLHPGESNLFSELRENGYYVWMNDRNDLFAGQIEGWAESNADEIYYCGQVKPAPRAVNRQGERNADVYSHFNGKLGTDESGRNYTSDDEAVDAAIKKIRGWEKEQPLCMFLGLNYPHVPYQIEEPYFSAIDRSKLPERIRYEDCIGKSKMLELIHEYEQMEEYSETEWNELRAVYLAMCKKVDEQFDKLCRELKKAGMYEDSLIIFLSDHGDYTGDYSVTEKSQNSFEDCVVRVPLLIKPPVWEKTDPGISDAMTELVDFYATVMDYADIKPQRTQFGISLRPVIEDRRNENRKYVFCEGGRLPEEKHCDEFHVSGPNGPSEKFAYWPKMKAQTDDEAHAKATMIRSTEFKYVSRILGSDEFYDLRKDPQEKHNCIHEKCYETEITKMQIALMKWMQETADVVPYELDSRFTPEMLWNKVKRMCPKGKEGEVWQKIKSGVTLGQLMMYMQTIRAEKTE